MAFLVIVVTALVFHILIDPFHDQVRHLQIVLLDHHHVRVAANAHVRKMHDSSISSDGFRLAGEHTAIVQPVLPHSAVGMITKDHQDRHRRQSSDLTVGVCGASDGAACRLDGDQASDALGIDQSRFEGEAPGVR